jgi:hypothetical protein
MAERKAAYSMSDTVIFLYGDTFGNWWVYYPAAGHQKRDA